LKNCQGKVNQFHHQCRYFGEVATFLKTFQILLLPPHLQMGLEGQA
jgi:hypothetical protein